MVFNNAWLFGKRLATRIPCIVSIFSILTAAFFIVPETANARRIRVGVYENKPLVFSTAEKQYQGFAVDILEYIGRKEGWNLQYIPGTWDECLDRLEKGKIDLQVAIADSPERERRFQFSRRSLINNWACVISAKNEPVESILDLKGKRICLLENDIHADYFRDLADKFDLQTRFIRVKSYPEIIRNVASGKAYAGVVNRLFAMKSSNLSNLKKTAVVFNPINVCFASPRLSDRDLLDRIDADLGRLKDNPESEYYMLVKKWFGGEVARNIPGWLVNVLIVGLLFIMAVSVLSILLKFQVNKKTKQLQHANHQLSDEITANRKISAQLEIGREKYKHIFNAPADPILILDAESGNILEVNRATGEMFGFASEKMLTSDFGLFSSGEEDYCAATFEKYLREAKETGPQRFDWRMKRADGQLFWGEITLRYAEYSSGKFIIAVIRDLTRRKEFENRLASEKERLAVTLQSIGDAVITTDTEGNVMLVNPVAEKLTGWTWEAALHRPITEVFHIINEQTRKPVEDPLQKVLSTGQIIGLANHTVLIGKDGVERNIADSGSPIHDRSGNIIGVVLVFRDITNDLKTERELLKARKLESVGILAGGIAHDFNNILMVILGNLNLVCQNLSSDNEVYLLVKDAEKACRRAKSLTQQLLTYARGGDPVRKAVSLNKLLRESVEFMMHGSAIQCNFDLPPDLWSAYIDTGQIDQVIQNIVLNARNAMPDGGFLDIACENVSDISMASYLNLPGGRYVKISIRDNGVGIPAKIIDKIFDPYFSTKSNGSGLGLAICYSIVNKHNGALLVDSIPGQGTCFTIYLPAADASVSDLSEPVPPGSEKECTILFMDDEPMVRDVAGRMLQRLGCRVIPAENGEEAVRIFRHRRKANEPVDLVFLDLTVKGGAGGEETVRKIRALDPDVDVIVCSGYAQNPVVANYEKYGFSGALTKPFDLNELRNLLRNRHL